MITNKNIILNHTIPFLSAVYNCSETEAKNLPLTYQTTCEHPDLKGSEFIYPEILYGSINKFYSKLIRLNDSGKGIFFSTGTTGMAKRSQSDITVFNFVVVDLDFKERDQQIHPDVPDILSTFQFGEAGLPPTAIVSSGHGCHLYLALSTPASRSDWPSLLQIRMGMVEAYKSWGSDSTVAVDMARAIRLPGFFNMKYEPVLCQLLQTRSITYSIEDLLSVFPYTKPLPLAIQTQETIDDPGLEFTYQTTIDEDERIYLACEALDLHPSAVWGDGGSNTALRAAQIGFAHALTPQQVFDLLILEYNDRCEPPWSSNELKHKVLEAYRFAKKNQLIGSALPDYKQQRRVILNKYMAQFTEVEDGN